MAELGYIDVGNGVCYFSRMSRLLVVEDNRELCAVLQRGLSEEGYSVDTSNDGEDAIVRATTSDYDLIVLDYMLPRRDGVSAAKELRRLGVRSGILMLTARDTLNDKVLGLDAGVDDYLTKPFEFKELLARLRALSRRGGYSVVQFADLTLDPSRQRAERAGKLLDLSAREFALLEFFVRHAGEVLSRTRIAEAIWEGEGGLDSNVVDVYVSYLRQKVDRPFETNLIQTVRGIGYVLRAED